MTGTFALCALSTIRAAVLPLCGATSRTSTPCVSRFSACEFCSWSLPFAACTSTFALAAAPALMLAGAIACKGPAKKSKTPEANPSTYSRLVIAGDPDVSGVFDPSPSYDAAAAKGWLAYSGVDYVSSGGNLVQDVQTNIASSSDGGVSWTFVQTAAPPRRNATFTMPDSSLCGSPQCTGHFISEVPFLVDDPTDPDPARRWELFEHRYLLYPPAQATGGSLQYATGAIYLQTAASPDGAWTAGAPVL